MLYASNISNIRWIFWRNAGSNGVRENYGFPGIKKNLKKNQNLEC